MKNLKTIIVGVCCVISSLWAQEDSLIRLNATIQKYSVTQPWEKAEPYNKNGLVALIEGGHILATADMVADSVFLELESANRNIRIPAKVKVVDYDSNLALLEGADEAAQKQILELLKPIQVKKESKLGETLTLFQVQSSGKFISTPGVIQGAEALNALKFKVKASMQRATNSRLLPAFKDGELIGLMTSYSSEEQIVNMISPETITSFLADAEDGDYKGFPSLGVQFNNTRDENLRAWLKLDGEMGGVYILNVDKGSAAEASGIKEGDVLLAIGGKSIDKQGYITSENYGKLYFHYSLHAGYKIGDEAVCTILRKGEKQEVKVKLKSQDEGVLPTHTYDKLPNFYIKGGMVFQELSSSYVRAYGKDWKTRAPTGLLDVYYNPHDYQEGRNRVVFISGVVRTPATIGYESMSQVLVEKVNGIKIADIKSLAEALEKPIDGIHTIEVSDKPKKLYLSEEATDKVDEVLKKRGIPFLHRY